MSISKLCNQFFQEKEPWKTKDKDALITLANIVKDLGILIEPFLPKTSESIFRQLNAKNLGWKDLGKETIKSGHKINKQELLFKKLEDKDIKDFRERFKGKKTEQKSDLFQLNLKVAKVLDVKDHPDAEKLYILQIDLGKEKRQIVAGMRKYYSKEEMLGKHIVVVTNLEPVKLRGFDSNGMLLAGDDGTNVRLVLAEKSKPGDQVTYTDKVNEKQINYDAFSKVVLEVKDKKVFADGNILKTEKEDVICDISKGKVK
jgi:methionyl-tRNA synthetase